VNGGNPENPSGLLSQQALPRPQKIRADDQGLDLAKTGGLKRYGKRTLAGVTGKVGFAKLWMRGRIALLDRFVECGDE
jgi:hypothetical protein